MSNNPKALVEQLEFSAELPLGTEERFNGYGVMGLPFASGHVLALRRFPATSIGACYAAVWHRNPAGEWSFYSDAGPRKSCARYFGEEAKEAVETDIRIDWEGPFQLRVEMPAIGFTWDISLSATVATRMMNVMGSLLPDAAWRNKVLLKWMGAMAGPVLGVGEVALTGRVPNGQWFEANPRRLWSVVESRAALAKEDFGLPGPVQPQARLGDFRIPQCGIFAIGQAYFEPFDPLRHSSRTSGLTGSIRQEIGVLQTG